MIATYSSSASLGGLPPTFRHWQKQCYELRIPPVIAVAGSRGKSTVVRLLQAIFEHAGLESAIWTDFGVEIAGRRQRGEIAGWNRALTRLTERSLDIAIQELDWSLVSAVGLPKAMYPIGAITNLCGNSDECMRSPLGRIAKSALPRVAEAIHPAGMLCANGEDFALGDALSRTAACAFIVAKSDASPLLRHHRELGGKSLWIRERTSLVGGDHLQKLDIADILEFPICRDGAASFQQTNVLIASAAALAAGIGPDIIRESLRQFDHTPDLLPGSFSDQQVGSIRSVVDRISPSWFLKSTLRAANPRSERRQITVVGGLASLPPEDLFEVGRMLGRSHGALIHHGDISAAKFAEFKKGLARNDYPPMLVSLPTERRAINRALRAVRADDVLLFLGDGDPGPALRAVDRLR